MSAKRIVQPERIKDPMTGEVVDVVFHLPDGRPGGADEWAPIRCGGGIALPGPVERVNKAAVCPSCLDGASNAEA
jgi:hypothetical protein